ncbi:hypothetical protein gp30 [Burkholderia phage KS9]|uniref:hypothetical protein gp30 n=1 Tax=Burkholderia phage KS9 TaxID=335797 RepID=UPI0001B07E74|nr:hypothetical protein [Burkholderia sp. BCC0322]YP_003090207.1 hypothetical protein gp30 [Burkholderia phage KS9]ACT83042.1 hypothetical protein gp30 [Burkholderia phage KS9]
MKKLSGAEVNDIQLILWRNRDLIDLASKRGIVGLGIPESANFTARRKGLLACEYVVESDGRKTERYGRLTERFEKVLTHVLNGRPVHTMTSNDCSAIAARYSEWLDVFGVAWSNLLSEAHSHE